MIPGPEFVQNHLSSIWPEWRVIRQLEKENGRSIFEICLSNSGTKQTKALKVLYFENVPDRFAQNAVSHLEYLKRMNRHPSIVPIEDYSFRMSGNDCLILIRTERLTSLPERITGGVPFTNEEVIRMGAEICEALNYCEQQHIIHSDIRFTSIFYGPDNTFKLGDFGVPHSITPIAAQSPEVTGTSLLCIAPEVYNGDKYSNTADLYSLGIILYTLLNNNFSPFTRELYEQTGGLQTYEANMLRLSGKEFPAPKGANEELSHVILKACSPNPGYRFQTAKELQGTLCGFLDEMTVKIIPFTGGSMAGRPIPVPDFPGQSSYNPPGGTDFGRIPPGSSPDHKTPGNVESDPVSTRVTQGNEMTDREGGQNPTPKSPYKKVLNVLIAICAILALCIVFVLFSDSSGGLFDNIGRHPVNYRITFVDETGAMLEETVYEGNEGDEIKFTAPEKEGYTLREATQSMTLISDADENRLIFVYDSDSGSGSDIDSEEKTVTESSTETTTKKTTKTTAKTTTKTTAKTTTKTTAKTTTKTTAKTTVKTTTKTTAKSTATTAPEEVNADVVVWTDPRLESAVKQYLNITGDLTLQEAGNITVLPINILRNH